MAGNNQRSPVNLERGPDGSYRLTWRSEEFDRRFLDICGEGFCDFTLEDVESKFPHYYKAIEDCHNDPNPTIPLEDLKVVATFSFLEHLMRKKRFQVYQKLV